jgi:hypothetical protein
MSARASLAVTKPTVFTSLSCLHLYLPLCKYHQATIAATTLSIKVARPDGASPS